MFNIAILLARLDSKRLPNKHFKMIGNKFLIDHCLDRLLLGKMYKVVLATSDRSVDNPLDAWAKERNIGLYRGDAVDIKQRIAGCISEFEATFFARVNADSPFVDAVLLDDGFNVLSRTNADLYTNLFPRSYPYGYSVEIFKSSTFIKTISSNTELEDVSSYFYKHSEKFSIINKYLENSTFDKVRLTVDTEEDLERMRAAYKKTESLFSLPLHDIIQRFK